jgi:hypothetical protein
MCRNADCAYNATLLKQVQALHKFFWDVFMHHISHISHLDQEISGLKTPNLALFLGLGLRFTKTREIENLF